MESFILSDETIISLQKLKRKDESLADVITRLVKEKQRQNEMKKEFQKFEGILEETEDWEETEKKIYETRRTLRNQNAYT